MAADAFDAAASHLDAASAAALLSPTTSTAAKVSAAVTQALECPCFDDVRSGNCWQAFADAFRCYGESTSDVRGEECGDTYKGAS